MSGRPAAAARRGLPRVLRAVPAALAVVTLIGLTLGFADWLPASLRPASSALIALQTVPSWMWLLASACSAAVGLSVAFALGVENRRSIAEQPRPRPRELDAWASNPGSAMALTALSTPQRLLSSGGVQGVLTHPAFLEQAQRKLDSRRGAALLIIDTHRYVLLEAQSSDTQMGALLQQFGARIRSADLGASLIGHLGRDRFALWMQGTTDPDQAKAQGIQLASAFSEPFEFKGQKLRVQVSIGISLYPEHGQQLQQLIERADIARHAAHHQPVVVYRDALEMTNGGHARMLTELEYALRADRLEDQYAPQRPLRKDLSPRARLLPSWPQDSARSVTEPAFLNLPSRLAELHALSHWLLDRSLSRLASWHIDGRPGVGIVVRLPDQALSRLPVADMVQKLMNVHILHGPILTLEFSLSGARQNVAQAREQMQKLLDLRVGLCASDPSAERLLQAIDLNLNRDDYLPFSEIRFPARLIGRAGRDPEAHEQLQALGRQCLALRLGSVIPGVVRADELQLATELKASYAEGPAVGALKLASSLQKRNERSRNP